MVKYMASWDILPGKESEYRNYVYLKGIPMYENAKGIRFWRSYQAVGLRAPLVFIEAEFDTAEDVVRFLSDPLNMDTFAEMRRLTSNISEWILVPTGRTEGLSD